MTFSMYMSNQLTQDLAVVSMALFSYFKHLVVFTQMLIARKPHATFTSIDHARTGLGVSLVSGPARLNETESRYVQTSSREKNYGFT